MVLILGPIEFYNDKLCNNLFHISTTANNSDCFCSKRLARTSVHLTEGNLRRVCGAST